MVTARKPQWPANIAAFSFVCFIVALGLLIATGHLDPFSYLLSGPVAKEYFADNPKSKTFQWSDQNLENWNIRFFEPNTARPLWQLRGKRAWPDAKGQFQFEEVVADIFYELSILKGQKQSKLRISSQSGYAKFLGKDKLVLHFGAANHPVTIIGDALTFTVPSAELTIPLKARDDKKKNTTGSKTQSESEADNDNLANRLSSTQFDISQVSLTSPGPVQGKLQLNKLDSSAFNQWNFAEALTIKAESLSSQGLDQISMTGPVVIKIPEFQFQKNAPSKDAKKSSKIPEWARVGLILTAGQLDTALIYAKIHERVVKTDSSADKDSKGKGEEQGTKQNQEQSKTAAKPKKSQESEGPNFELLRLCRVKLSRGVKFQNVNGDASGQCEELDIDLIPGISSSQIHTFLGSGAVAGLESVRQWNQLEFERLILKKAVTLKIPSKIERDKEKLVLEQQLSCEYLEINELNQELIVRGTPFQYQDLQIRKTKATPESKVIERQRRKISGGELLLQRSQQHFALRNNWQFDVAVENYDDGSRSAVAIQDKAVSEFQFTISGDTATGQFASATTDLKTKKQFETQDLSALNLLGTPINLSYQSKQHEQAAKTAKREAEDRDQSVKFQAQTESIQWQKDRRMLTWSANQANKTQLQLLSLSKSYAGKNTANKTTKELSELETVQRSEYEHLCQKLILKLDALPNFSRAKKATANKSKDTKNPLAKIDIAEGQFVGPQQKVRFRSESKTPKTRVLATSDGKAKKPTNTQHEFIGHDTKRTTVDLEARQVLFERKNKRLTFRESVALQSQQSATTMSWDAKSQSPKSSSSDSATTASGELIIVDFVEDPLNFVAKAEASKSAQKKNKADFLEKLESVAFRGSPAKIAQKSADSMLDVLAEDAKFWQKSRKFELSKAVQLSFSGQSRKESTKQGKNKAKATQKVTLFAENARGTIAKSLFARLNSQKKPKTGSKSQLGPKKAAEDPFAILDLPLNDYFEAIELTAKDKEALTVRIESAQANASLTGRSLKFRDSLLTLESQPFDAQQQLSGIVRTKALKLAKTWPLLQVQSNKDKAVGQENRKENGKPDEADQSSSVSLNAQLFGSTLKWQIDQSQSGQLIVEPLNSAVKEQSPRQNQNREKRQPQSISQSVYCQLFDKDFNESGFLKSDALTLKTLKASKSLQINLSGTVQGQFDSTQINQQKAKNKANPKTQNPWVLSFSGDEAVLVSRYQTQRKEWIISSGTLTSKRSVVKLSGRQIDLPNSSQSNAQKTEDKKKTATNFKRFALVAPYLNLSNIAAGVKPDQDPYYLIESKLSRRILPKVETDNDDLLSAEILKLKLVQNRDLVSKDKPKAKASLLSRVQLELQKNAFVRLKQKTMRNQKSSILVTSVKADNFNAQLNMAELQQLAGTQRWQSLESLNAQGKLQVNSVTTTTNAQGQVVEEQRTVKGESLRYTKASQKAEIVGRPVIVESVIGNGSKQIVEIPKTTIRLPGSQGS